MAFNRNLYYQQVARGAKSVDSIGRSFERGFDADSDFRGDPNFTASLAPPSGVATPIYGETGLGQLKEIVEGLKKGAQDQIVSWGKTLGEETSKPAVAEVTAKFKSYLPWILLGVVAMTAVGGFWGQAAFRARKR